MQIRSWARIDSAALLRSTKWHYTLNQAKLLSGFLRHFVPLLWTIPFIISEESHPQKIKGISGKKKKWKWESFLSNTHEMTFFHFRGHQKQLMYY